MTSPKQHKTKDDEFSSETKVTVSPRPLPSLQHLSIEEIIKKEEILNRPEKRSYLSALMSNSTSSSSIPRNRNSKSTRRKKKKRSGLSIVLSPRRRVPRFEDVSFGIPSNVTVKDLSFMVLVRFRSFLMKKIPLGLQEIDSVRRLLKQLPENSQNWKLEVRYVFFIADEKGEIDRSFPKLSKDTRVIDSGRKRFCLKWRLNKSAENSMNRSHVFEFPIFIEKAFDSTFSAKTLFVTWNQLRKTMCRVVEKTKSEDLTNKQTTSVDLGVSLKKKNDKSEPDIFYKGENVKPRVVVSWAYHKRKVKRQTVLVDGEGTSIISLTLRA